MGAMRSRIWSRRLWKSQLLLLFCIGAVILWNNVEFVAGQETQDANPDGIADAAAEDDGTPADPTIGNAKSEDATTTGDAAKRDPTLSSTGIDLISHQRTL